MVHLNMLMRTVAGEAIPITKVLSHCMVLVKRYRGLVKSDEVYEEPGKLDFFFSTFIHHVMISLDKCTISPVSDMYFFYSTPSLAGLKSMEYIKILNEEI